MNDQPKIDAEDLKNYIELNVPDVTWDGPYRGRGFFEGVAVRYDSQSDLLALAAKLAGHHTFAPIADKLTHHDNLGLGYVSAWSNRLFTDDSLAEIEALQRQEEL